MQPNAKPSARPQRAHIVDVGDIILIQDADLQRRFGADRLTIAAVSGNWAWAGDESQWGFTPRTLREWLDAGKITLACVPRAAAPDPEEDERRLAEGRCLTCGVREGVKWLPTMDGPLPVCAAHVVEMAAGYAALEEEEEEEEGEEGA